MARVSRDAFACAPIPDLEAPVYAAADEFRVVELKTADAGFVAMEGANLFAAVDVPDFDGAIIGASGEDRVIKLQAHDPIGVASKDLGGTSTVFPIRANFEAVFVYVFPRSSLFEVRLINVFAGRCSTFRRYRGDAKR